MEAKKFKKLLVVGIVLFVLIIITISIVSLVWNKKYSATLEIYVAPSDSGITLNGEEIRAGIHKSEPGEYEIIVSRNGFDAQSQKVTLEADEKKKVYFALMPNDESTANWYETHPEDAELLEGISSWEYDQVSDEMRTRYEILENLPFYGSAYMLGYGNCKKTGGPEFCVVIKADFGFRDAAVGYLQNTGKDLAEYYVDVVDYTSPFNEVALNVPEGLEYDEDAEEELDTKMLENELSNVLAVANNRINNLKSADYVARVLQLVGFGGGKYCGVKVGVYHKDNFAAEEQNELLHDTYRMIMAKIDGNWRVVTGLKFLLDYESNPKLSEDLIRLMNEF